MALRAMLRVDVRTSRNSGCITWEGIYPPSLSVGNFGAPIMVYASSAQSQGDDQRSRTQDDLLHHRPRRNI
jgi:hypothetical protein